MQKNLYFRTVIRRNNIIKSFIFDFFYSIASLPRLMLEVFIRKNFGERYFSGAAAVTILIIMGIIPVMSDRLSSFLHHYYYSDETPSFWLHYATWYLFLAAFAYFAYQRWQEVKRNPSVFDFGKFSLATGNIHPFFFTLRIFGQRPSVRAIEIIYEPTLFFLAGGILAFFGQKIGIALMTTSIIYGLSYAAAYKRGDNFVMDKIDEIILNEELTSAFVEDLVSTKTRGVRFYTHKPASKTLRQKLAETFIEETAPALTETFAE